MPKIRAHNLAEHRDLIWGSIVTALAELLASKSFDRITLAEVAATAGIARNTIYNYAPDKSALIAAAAEETGEALLSNVADLAGGEATATSRLVSIIRVILHSFGSDRHRHILLQSLFQSVPGPAQARASAPLIQMLQHVRRVLAEGVRSGEFRRLDDIDLTLRLMTGVMHSAVLKVVHESGKEKSLEKEVTRFLLEALNKH